MVFSYATLYVLQFAIYHGIQIMLRLRQKEKEALELAVLAREQELSALKSQINPHFLFNTLNSISAVASRDAEETRTMIAELGDLFRYATEISKRDLVPLQEELEFTRSYLDLESKRIGDRLQVEYRIAPEAAQCRIPPLILQPLVENAIKHGIEPSETGGRLSIVIEVIKGCLVTRIVDTGVGPPPAARLDANGIGLRNTDLRLRKLFGEGAAVQTRIMEAGGFEVTFSIPIDLEAL
jgi:two-component system LytT family sensor kinase